MALRWGIVSTAALANDFCYALRTLSDLEHEVVAVCPVYDSLEHAEAFAKTHEIGKVFPDYGELAEDPWVEAVFVASGNHFDISYLMLENGKHVLVEKPMAQNERDVRRLIMYAERKKLFLMEAIWTRFFPSYQYLRRLIRNDALGAIKSVDIEMGFALRPRQPLDPEK